MRVATMAAGLVLVLAACGGEKKAPEAPAAAAPAPEAAAPATPAPDAAAPAATGASVDVNMELDGTNYVYKPASLTVKAGDHILYGKYAGTDVKWQGEDLKILRESEVLALLPK